MAMPFEKCPVCGGELIDKQVEKLLRGGLHTAVVAVFAEVSLRCGERLHQTRVHQGRVAFQHTSRVGEIAQ